MYQTKFNPQVVLKPQDLVVLLRLSVQDGVAPTYAVLAQELGLTASEIHAGLERATLAKLAHKDKRGKAKVEHEALMKLMSGGVEYIFPAIRGTVVKGIATAHAAPPLIELLPATAELPPVWPYKQGDTKGVALYPLYPSVPEAALRSPLLREMLALFDAVRSGDEAQRKMALHLMALCWQ